MKAIDFSPEADVQFKKIIRRLNRQGQVALGMELCRMEKLVRKSVIKDPPGEDKCNYLQSILHTMLYDYTITVAGWTCDCCDSVVVEVVTISEEEALSKN